MTETTERAVAERVPALARETLRVVQRRGPLTVPPGTSLAECLRLIQRSGVGDSVLVTDGQGRLAGVLAERDIVAHLLGEPVDLRRPVEAMMNREPKTFRIDQTVHEAITLMASGVYRNVPIVDDDRRVVGIVRQVDILRYLAEAFPEELLNLPPRPHQKMKESEGA